MLTKLGAILCHLINTLSSFSVEIEEVVVVYGAIKAVNVIIACQHHGKTLCIIVGCKAQRDSRERPLSDVKDTYLHQSIVLSSDSLCPFIKSVYHTQNATIASFAAHFMVDKQKLYK